MNSLEWIDKQILLVKENIQYHKDLLAESEEEYTDEIISAIKLLEPELQTLQQIKTELEAWYEIKNLYLKGYFSRVVLPNGSNKKFKKALEVKDELKK